MTKPNPVVEALEEAIRMLEITMLIAGHVDAKCDEAIKSGKATLPLAREMAEEVEATEARNAALTQELAQLRAAYARVVEALENNQWIVGETGGEICPECGGMRRINGHEDFCSIGKALSATPESVQDIVAVVEIAKKIANSEMYEIQGADGPVMLTRTGLDLLDENEEAVRNLKEKP